MIVRTAKTLLGLWLAIWIGTPMCMSMDIDPESAMYVAAVLAAAWLEWRFQARAREEVVDFKAATEHTQAQNSVMIAAMADMSDSHDETQAQVARMNVELGKLQGMVMATCET